MVEFKKRNDIDISFFVVINLRVVLTWMVSCLNSFKQAWNIVQEK